MIYQANSVGLLETALSSSSDTLVSGLSAANKLFFKVFFNFFFNTRNHSWAHKYNDVPDVLVDITLDYYLIRINGFNLFILIVSIRTTKGIILTPLATR